MVEFRFRLDPKSLGLMPFNDYNITLLLCVQYIKQYIGSDLEAIYLQFLVYDRRVMYSFFALYSACFLWQSLGSDLTQQVWGLRPCEIVLNQTFGYKDI